MTFTLSNLLQAIYTELGQLQVSTATGGTTTTLVDSVMISSGGQDDVWKNAALLILQDIVGSTPQGEFQRVSAYDDSTGTFTLDTAFSAAPAAGDTYGLASEYYPLRTMIEIVNAGLRALGDIPLVDSTTLTTAAGQTEYPASLPWKRRPPTRIDIQSQTGDSDDNHWQRVFDWEFVPASPGTTGLIVFAKEPTAGRFLRIWYQDSHPRVAVYNDSLSEVIAPDLAVAAGVERALRWQNSRLGGGDPFLLQRWNDAKEELRVAKVEYPIWLPGQIARLKLAGVGGRSW